jgi:hypothetical protein
MVLSPYIDSLGLISSAEIHRILGLSCEKRLSGADKTKKIKNK